MAGVTGESGCGRISVLGAGTLVGGVSDAIRTERGEFCPTTYPIANATAKSRTTMKNPLSNWRFPTTSSNSPVSLFLID